MHICIATDPSTSGLHSEIWHQIWTQWIQFPVKGRNTGQRSLYKEESSHCNNKVAHNHIFPRRGCHHLYKGMSMGGSECGNRISSGNFYTVFHSNCASILLTSETSLWCRQWTMDGQTMDGPTSTTNVYMALVVSHQ